MKAYLNVFLALIIIITISSCAARKKKKAIQEDVIIEEVSTEDVNEKIKSGEKNTKKVFHDSNSECSLMINKISIDASYGYQPINPILLGDGKTDANKDLINKYLNNLAGPNGEKLSFYKKGECCQTTIYTENQTRLVKVWVYEVSSKAFTAPKILYINPFVQTDGYEAPKGFSYKGLNNE